MHYLGLTQFDAYGDAMAEEWCTKKKVFVYPSDIVFFWSVFPKASTNRIPEQCRKSFGLWLKFAAGETAGSAP